MQTARFPTAVKKTLVPLVTVVALSAAATPAGAAEPGDWQHLLAQWRTIAANAGSSWLVAADGSGRPVTPPATAPMIKEHRLAIDSFEVIDNTRIRVQLASSSCESLRQYVSSTPRTVGIGVIAGQQDTDHPVGCSVAPVPVTFDITVPEGINGRVVRGTEVPDRAMHTTTGSFNTVTAV